MSNPTWESFFAVNLEHGKLPRQAQSESVVSWGPSLIVSVTLVFEFNPGIPQQQSIRTVSLIFSLVRMVLLSEQRQIVFRTW